MATPASPMTRRRTLLAVFGVVRTKCSGLNASRHGPPNLNGAGVKVDVSPLQPTQLGPSHTVRANSARAAPRLACSFSAASIRRRTSSTDGGRISAVSADGGRALFAGLALIHPHRTPRDRAADRLCVITPNRPWLLVRFGLSRIERLKGVGADLVERQVSKRRLEHARYDELNPSDSSGFAPTLDVAGPFIQKGAEKWLAFHRGALQLLPPEAPAECVELR